ncbi:UNVERIFIED_CONTAM: hypothetical protein RMT77_005968 [Armadillidium vulgare]
MEENDFAHPEKKRKLSCKSAWEQIIDLENKQWKDLLSLNYNSKVECIYNPLEYAKEPHVNFVKTYCGGEKKVLLLGMNPGPWGMCQTGVPFGEVDHVKNWLNIDGKVERPSKELRQKPIHGFECTRSEVSGNRMWSLLKELSGDPKTLFEKVFIHNYCPLAFLSKTGKNITPVELPVEERKSLEEICDKYLIQVIELLKVEFLVCIGNYVSQRSQKALERSGVIGVQVSTLMHPSPINPKANKGWKQIAIKQLQEANVLEYFSK